MSVRDVGREEIEALMHQWNGLGEGPLTRMLYEQTKKQVPVALAAAYAANKAAQFVSYGDPPVFESLEGIDKHKASSADPIGWCTEIEKLLYNTVTNAGTDFLPMNYRRILEGVTTSIYRQVASSSRAARKPTERGPQV